MKLKITKTKLLVLAGSMLVFAAPNPSGAEERSARPQCNDSKGSTLAMHSRELCKELVRRGERPGGIQRYIKRDKTYGIHVKDGCAKVTSTRSSCTWRITWSKKGEQSMVCSGDATVKGRAHLKFTIKTRACVA